MDIEIKELRCAVALAEHQNFSKASRTLNLSQPAFSRIIQDLEIRIGQQLFRRGSGSTQLTDSGEIFIQQARKLLLAADQLRTEVGLIRGNSSRVEELRVGIGMYPADIFLAQAVSRFLAVRRKNVQLRLITDTYANLITPLQKAELHFGLFDVSTLQPAANWNFIRLAERIAHVIVRSSHPLLNTSAPLSWSQVQMYPWVLPSFSSGNRLRDLLATGRDSAKESPSAPEIYVNSLALMKRIVEHSDGWMIGALSNVSRELSAGVLQILPIPILSYTTDFAIVWPVERSLSPVAREFAAVLQQADAESAAEDVRLESLYNSSDKSSPTPLSPQRV